MRYRIGFPNPDIKCPFTDRNPGYVPIVDTQAFFYYGVVIALCDNADIAAKITFLLNRDYLNEQPHQQVLHQD